MIAVFLAVAIFSSLLAVYFAGIVKNKTAVLICTALSVKIVFIVFLLLGTSAGLTVLVACLIGALALFIPAIARLKLEPKTGVKEIIVVFVFIIVAALFSGGCAVAGPPSPNLEINLKFKPAKILALNREEIFICAETEKYVYKYSLKEKKITAVIECGNIPSDLLLDGKRLYISSMAGGSITAYNIDTKKTWPIKIGGQGQSALALSKDCGKLYATNMKSSSVSVLDLTSLKVTNKITTGRWPSDITVSPDGKYLYVICQYTNTFEVVDLDSEQPVLTKINTGVSPVSMALIGKNKVAVVNEWEYAANHKSAVVIIDTKDGYNVEKSLLVDGGVYCGLTSKSREYIMLSVPSKDKVIFVNLRTGKKKYELYFKDYYPKYMTLSPGGGMLFVACPQAKKIMLINIAGAF